jgi:predicted metalloendopeptidase
MEIFKENDPSSKCLNLISNKMPLALSKYYVEINFPENIKSETVNMVENIRNAMIKRIQELEWLDESTRKYAIEKVLKIKYNLGYTDFVLNHEMIYNKYKSIGNIHDDFLSMLMSIENESLKDKYKLFYNENPENSINEIPIMPTYIVNALYSPNTNHMDFPAAVLQEPNFDVNQPDYINYGNMGSTMGHELTHAFDNNGKKYDSDGKEFNWWTDNDNEEFNEFSQCYIDQYGNYSSEIEGKKYYVDGINTLNENLADNGGLDRAFEAWKMSIEKNPEIAKTRNMKLPGLSEYTMEQLFYISYAHANCEVRNNKKIFEDTHSPGVFRVNGVVSNNKRFAKIFNCPAKSPMNPDHKCTLW